MRTPGTVPRHPGGVPMLPVSPMPVAARTPRAHRARRPQRTPAHSLAATPRRIPRLTSSPAFRRSASAPTGRPEVRGSPTGRPRAHRNCLARRSRPRPRARRGSCPMSDSRRPHPRGMIPARLLQRRVQGRAQQLHRCLLLFQLSDTFGDEEAGKRWVNGSLMLVVAPGRRSSWRICEIW